MMSRRAWRATLISIPSTAALMCGLDYLYCQNWSRVLEHLPSALGIALVSSFSAVPWIGGWSRRWEWYSGRHGLSLREVNDPITPYGLSIVSTKRDTIVSVERTQWREHPALKISWRYGSGKTKTGLFVYRAEDDGLVGNTLMPQLLSWLQRQNA